MTTGVETATPFESSPLTVVSNRLPFSAALEPALRRLGGVRVGWPGVSLEQIEAAGRLEIPPEEDLSHTALVNTAHILVALRPAATG